jgi:glycosyltransferase involved in cell wall biosynthesis
MLLCVGRLSPEKGHPDLIDAIRQLDEVPAFHLVIVGEGPEHRALERKIEKLELGKFVTLAGQQNDLNAYYSAADIFVLPSHSEGSPNVLLEAMAAAIPVVATRVGGVPEIATDGRTSLLVPSKNPRAIAEALKRLLNDRQLRRELGQTAVQRAAQYDPAHYSDSIVEIHRRLLQDGR